jgi:hypothetical protein
MRRTFYQPAKKAGRTATSSLIKELDGLFSEWLRRGNSVNGKCECFICGRKARWQEMQAGHYIDRDQMSLRFDIRNVHVVCPSCNLWDQHHQIRFRNAIQHKQGPEVLSFIESKKRSLQKWMPFELQERIDYLKAELKKMK